MDIKLIALDMDGTLLDRDHVTISPRNLNALQAAMARGITVSIASGRSWSLLREIAQKLPGAHYAITANGACTMDLLSGRRTAEVGMDRAQCKAIVRILRKHRLPYELYIDGENCIEQGDIAQLKGYGFSADFVDVFLRCATLTDDMLLRLDHGVAEKFDVFYVDPALRPQVLAELEATGPFSNAGALENNLEISAPGADKGKALALLCAQLDIAPEQVMAFGDGDNDPEMLTWAGWSFAMENGSAGAKAAAKHRAPPNYESGVGQMIERYVLEQIES